MASRSRRLSSVADPHEHPLVSPTRRPDHARLHGAAAIAMITVWIVKRARKDGPADAGWAPVVRPGPTRPPWVVPSDGGTAPADSPAAHADCPAAPDRPATPAPDRGATNPAAGPCRGHVGRQEQDADRNPDDAREHLEHVVLRLEQSSFDVSGRAPSPAPA